MISAPAARESLARECALTGRPAPGVGGRSGVPGLDGCVRMASGSGEGVTEGGERADHFRDHGGIGVLVGPNLLEIDAGPEEDPRRDELQGVVAAYARAQR